MINQQINLHQPIFRKQRALFSAQIVLRICAIWAIALGAVYGLALLREAALLRERTRLLEDRDTATARFSDLTLRRAGSGSGGMLEAELGKLQAERAQKESVLRVLARGDLGDTTGFAPQLRTLAERRVSGVWLTHVALRAGGRDISLRGIAEGEELLPEYLERLAGGVGDPRFPGARFGQVRLQRLTDDAGVEFELHTKSTGAAP